MKKMGVILSKNANYIYHMLSVAKCGYDNLYGEKYRKYHNEEDLHILKKHQNLISVRGGQHSGQLYYFLISIPSGIGDDKIYDYYSTYIDLMTTSNLEEHLKNYKHIYEISFADQDINLENLKMFYNQLIDLKQPIIEICSIFLSNYDIYLKNIWSNTKAEIKIINKRINERLSTKDYIGIWEKELGYVYKNNNFYGVLVNSIANGPEAIDINEYMDLLSTFHKDEDLIALMNHELGIFILKNNFPDPYSFYDNYKFTESLAEYFNQKITGGHKEYNWYNDIIELYKNLKEKNPNLTPYEMYLKAINYN